MRIGIVSSNPSFINPIASELDKRGHDVILYQHTGNEAQDMYQIGQLKAVAERVFVDFAQYPLEIVLKEFDCPIFVRLHRIEGYNREYLESLDLSKVNKLFFVAPHVHAQVNSYTIQPPKAQGIYHAGADTDFWKIDEAAREYSAPYRIVIVGNVCPKKRVYTALQLAYDLGEDFYFECYGNGAVDNGYGNFEYHNNVSDLITELGMEQRFCGAGRLSSEDLREKFQRAHFVISASNEEGCHTTIAEGMACGCVPLVNCWKGAGEIYPKEWIWHSPKELYALVDKWLALSVEEKQALSREMRQFVVERYDSKELAAKVCDAITGPIDAVSVGEWYSTAMLDHMSQQDGNARQQEALQSVLDYMPESKPYSVLELGCGTGYISRELAKAGHKATGMDVAAGLLQFAVDHNEAGATFIQADVTKALAKGPWDIITMIDALEHIPEKSHSTVFARIAQELEPGGIFIARFPHLVDDNQIVEEHVFPKVVRKKLLQVGLKTEVFREVGGIYFELVAVKQ